MSLNSFDLNFWEDFLIVLFSYSILKYIIFSLIIEIIWPTNYFNRKHTTGFTLIRYRTFSETLLKLKNINSYFNIKFLSFFIFFKK